ncbi:MAG: TonB-dependent receptor plug domain-containing protein, partial [Flavobacterium stagni]
MLEFNPVMDSEYEQLGQVVISGVRPRATGVITVTPEVVRKIPGLNGGVENILKILGANGNSDMSTQYSVRGGNYDENLVYVNEVEIYRPFLIRSGQQEGLSFVNSDLIQKIDFYAGGFEAKYGDKMSSVLDITYEKPKEFGASLDASFLGGALSAKGISKDKKWSAIGGIRYRDNSLLVNSQETQTNYRPRYMDGQLNVNFMPSEKWNHSFLGNVSLNRYNYQPLTRQTNFGTLDEPIALQIFYEGQEDDRYQTLFGAYKTTFKPNDNNNYRFIASAYHTQEQEYFDIDASYFLGEVDANIGSETFGNVTFNRAIGSQLNHARNNLDALIFNAEIKGSNNQTGKHRFDWGVKYTHENIRDRIVEWEVIDSAGFSLNPPVIDIPVDQPYHPYIGPLVPYQNVRATNFVDINRFSGYAQWNTRTRLRRGTLIATAGVRAHNWTVSGQNIASKSQSVFSPRVQLAYKVDGKDL